MLCTSAQNVLMSLDGRVTLNYRPTTPPPYTNPYYNPDTKQLVILWDIIMQDYRAINMSYCNLIAKIPANEVFWEYFRKEIYPKKANQKMAWMDS